MELFHPYQWPKKMDNWGEISLLRGVIGTESKSCCLVPNNRMPFLVGNPYKPSWMPRASILGGVDPICMPSFMQTSEKCVVYQGVDIIEHNTWNANFQHQHIFLSFAVTFLSFDPIGFITMKKHHFTEIRSFSKPSIELANPRIGILVKGEKNLSMIDGFGYDYPLL